MSPPVYLKIFQVSSAFVSFISSSIMASSIAWFGSEGSTPYRRIILGLSISDIFQSLGFLGGPLAIPISRESKTVENEALSCQVNGLILQVATTAVLMHTVFLCVYYLCRLKYRMSDEKFKHKIERRFRALILTISFVAGIVPLAMNAYHINSLTLSLCTIANVPTDCWRDGTCEPSYRRLYRILSNVLVVGVNAVAMTAIVTIMVLLYHHSFVLNRRIQREVSVPTALRSASTGTSEEANQDSNELDDGKEKDLEADTPQSRVQQLSKLYQSEMMNQAVYYVGAYCLMYVPGAVSFVVCPPAFLITITMIFTPLGGFLNILVYTRPKVAELRRRYPECSRLRGFWIVLKTGGEIPDNMDLSLSCCEDCCSVPSCFLESGYDSDYSYRVSTRKLYGGPIARLPTDF